MNAAATRGYTSNQVRVGEPPPSQAFHRVLAVISSLILYMCLLNCTPALEGLPFSLWVHQDLQGCMSSSACLACMAVAHANLD